MKDNFGRPSRKILDFGLSIFSVLFNLAFFFLPLGGYGTGFSAIWNNGWLYGLFVSLCLIAGCAGSILHDIQSYKKQ